jgi:hypothetical protein
MRSVRVPTSDRPPEPMVFLCWSYAAESVLKAVGPIKEQFHDVCTRHHIDYCSDKLEYRTMGATW